MCVKTIKKAKRKNKENNLCKNSRKYFIICYKNLVGFDFVKNFATNCCLALFGGEIVIMIRLKNKKNNKFVDNLTIEVINELFG